MIETLFPFIVAVFALLIIPGPDMALVIANGAAYGRQGAFFSSLGISVGGMILTFITSIIVATATSINSEILAIIQLIGCLYLLYIAITTIYPKALVNDTVRELSPTTGNLFLRGVITNISNPKALIFFLAFIPQFIPETMSNSHITTFMLGVVLCAIGFCVNFVFGAVGSMLTGFNRIAVAGKTWGQWVIFAVFFVISIVFGAQLILDKLL